LDGFSCSVPSGSICALVGANGAGKTTLYSVICGFLLPDEGSVDILGEGAFDPFRFKGRIGVLPQDAALPERISGRDFLRFMASLQGIPRSAVQAAAERALRDVDLQDRGHALVATLSHGMRRRLSVAGALVGSPELVLLDEPTAGLDPAQARHLREMLRNQRGRCTLLVSSHNLDELERICDHVVLVDRGRCLREGSVAEVTGRSQVVTWLLGPGQPPLPRLRALLDGHEFRWDAEPAGAGGAAAGSMLVQRAPADADLDASSLALARALSEAGIAIRGVQRGRSLEESFLDVDQAARESRESA
jgi:ABC-type multidrug transport system ATPase subunit